MSKLKVSAATDALDPNEIQVGQWCWVGRLGKERWFGCVTHVGTNFMRLTAPDGHTSRVHFDKFWKLCEPVRDPDAIIADHLVAAQVRLDSLLNDVKLLTASLAIGPSPALQGSGDTQALVVATTGRSYKTYSQELVAAKKTGLPALFKQIEETTSALKHWMSAKIVPLKAQVGGLNDLIEHVECRIFNVELYAGLVEQIKQIRKGERAPLTTPVHLLQRRHYMDEECLSHYETGGMDYKSIDEFDAWLCRADNFERLLPFPRCILAMRIRRNDKERHAGSLSDFFRILEEQKLDKLTFLYIRNGARAYRLSTQIEFDGELFPDLDRSQLCGSKLWAKDMGCGKFKVITDNERTGMLEAVKQSLAEWEAKEAAYEAALKTPEARQRARELGKKRPDAACVDAEWPGHRPYDWDTGDYERYDRQNVYYDDITKQIGRDIQKHNRIALILQGLLDRSEVLHPHPPWQLWTDEGFEQGVVLVHDSSRAIPSGPAPDFEAYKARLAATIKAGSVTHGQELLWSQELQDRQDEHGSRRRDLYYGNPGPSLLARVARVSRTGMCTFEWLRERRSYSAKGKLLTKFTCKAADLFHVSAYAPGDVKQFFADPRTRADYLEWAAPMLHAEEFHAGNRKVAEPPSEHERPKRKPSSWEGQQRYERARKRKLLLGKAVKLRRQIETQGGQVYREGTLWRVHYAGRSGLTIHGICPDGTKDTASARSVRGVSFHDLEIDSSVPAEKEEE